MSSRRVLRIQVLEPYRYRTWYCTCNPNMFGAAQPNVRFFGFSGLSLVSSSFVLVPARTILVRNLRKKKLEAKGEEQAPLPQRRRTRLENWWSGACESELRPQVEERRACLVFRGRPKEEEEKKNKVWVCVAIFGIFLGDDERVAAEKGKREGKTCQVLLSP